MRNFIPLLRATFANYTSRAALFAAIMTAPFVGALAVNFLLHNEMRLIAAVCGLGLFMVQIFAMAALILAVCGRVDTFLASYCAAAKHFWRFLLYSVTVTFFSIGALLAGGFAGFLLGLPLSLLVGNTQLASILLSITMGLAGVAAIIYLSVRLVFGQLILVLEERGPIASLKATWQTVAGKWWQTFWKLCFFFFGVFAASFVVGILVGFASEFTAAMTGVGRDHELILHAVTTGLQTLVVTPLTICFIYELYRDVRTQAAEPAESDAE